MCHAADRPRFVNQRETKLRIFVRAKRAQAIRGRALSFTSVKIASFMKSVIMIAYHFPPEGNAGSYRPLRFVRHLTAQDWQPTVITLKTDFYERYDPSLLSLVPNYVEVIRVANRDPWQAFQARRGRQVQAKLLNSPAEIGARIQSMHQSPVRSSIRKLVHGIEACLYHPDPAMAWIGPRRERQCNFAIGSDPMSFGRPDHPGHHLL